jgi:hypothetical protein
VGDNRSLIDEFKAADTSGFPDLSTLDEREQMFWILGVAKDHLGRELLTPTDISTVLRDVYGIDLSRQRIEAMLSGEKKTVAKRKANGRRAYQLMLAGRQELESANTAAFFIDPARGYTGLRETQSLLAGLRGEIRVCDPYADVRTLDMLAECAAADALRLLTHNIKKIEGFKQSMRVFEREHGLRLEVRRSPDGVLHDRYLIHGAGMLMFGTSLNSLGLKQSFVVALGEDLRSAALAAFEATWDASSPP